MPTLLPAAFYGLKVPAGDLAVEAAPDFGTGFRITMAAIDPNQEPEENVSDEGKKAPRATLKLIRLPMRSEEDSDSEDDQFDALLNGDMSDEEDESDDEEINGGPSDPSKSKKGRREAAMKAFKDAIKEGVDKQEKVTNGTTGGTTKGKGKATSFADDDEDMMDETDESEGEAEEFVLCTLDPNQHYQQPLDITIGDNEGVLFKVSGAYDVHLSGNYVMLDNDPSRSSDDEDEDYDVSPYEDELDDLGLEEDSEGDELDDIDDPRIGARVTEIHEPETDGVVAAAAKSKNAAKKATGKGKNKRAAPESDEEPAGLDEIIGKAFRAEEQPNGDTKLSKKQMKKLKNNAGQPVTTVTETETKIIRKDNESPSGKKVQFAKELEQGPTKSKPKPQEVEKQVDGKEQNNSEKKGADDAVRDESLGGVLIRPGAKKVQGITIDDRTAGKGPAVKKGNKIGLRYIGKLADGKVFDSNKKGKPFSFKVGNGDVIEGMDIGVVGMQAGGERRLVIPAHLAYKNKAKPGIPANSQLTFDLKCLSVN